MELRETEPFEFETPVRYSEVDEHALISLPAIIDLFQDCSTFQSESLGVGAKWLRRTHRGWVLTHWRILIVRRPRLHETIRVGTFATRFKSVSAERAFYLRDESGDLIVKAESTWAFVDRDTGHPTRPTPEHVEPYGLHAPLDLPPAERKIEEPASLKELPPFTVRRHHIDTNGHMNNCEYVREALDLLPEGATVEQLRVNYRHAAKLGEVVHPKIAVEPGRIVVELCCNDGRPYAIVELS